MKIKDLLRKVLGVRLCDRLRRGFDMRPKDVVRLFERDCNRFLELSGYGHPDSILARRSLIVMLYHVVEKGLTMPGRRPFFGRDAVERLVREISGFEVDFGTTDMQVRHAVAVLKSYVVTVQPQTEDECEFCKRVSDFIAARPDIDPVAQRHVTRMEFYAQKNAPFPDFAAARHTTRHYAAEVVPIERIRAAVCLAQTAPTACNRRYCRVRCVSDRATMRRILDLQGGNRGFGHLATRLLVVTVDLEGIPSPLERNDIYTNGGMFLMNLCYALYYHEVAHCVLNWSRSVEDDECLRALVHMSPSEVVIALLSCGEPPAEFDVAVSPKIPLSDGFIDQ